MGSGFAEVWAGRRDGEGELAKKGVENEVRMGTGSLIYRWRLLAA